MQSSEGFNAVLKRYVSLQNSLLNFVKQYRKIQKEVLSMEIEN
jgi:predicted patatin/cPLA2 family phospholipase